MFSHLIHDRMLRAEDEFSLATGDYFAVLGNTSFNHVFPLKFERHCPKRGLGGWGGELVHKLLQRGKKNLSVKFVLNRA